MLELNKETCLINCPKSVCLIIQFIKNLIHRKAKIVFNINLNLKNEHLSKEISL